MCRWHTMNRREKCRCISLVLITLMAIAGCVGLIYGSVQLFRVSKQGLESDGGGVDQLLDFFTSCHDIQPPTGEWSSDVIGHAMKFQCVAKQLPARVTAGLAGACMVLAILCVPAAFKKDKMFGFTLWSTLSIMTILMSVVVMSVYALPAVSSMAPHCNHYDAATVQELQSMGIVCLKGVEGVPNKTTALKWLCKLHTFYGGAALSVISLLMLFMTKTCCCCNPSSCCPSSSSSSSTPSACGNGASSPCVIRRAVHKIKARFCRRSDPLSSSADRDDGLPISAPSYYQVTPAANNSQSEGEVSEDAGVVSSGNSYYGVN